MIQQESRNLMHHHSRRMKSSAPEPKTPVQDDPTSTEAMQTKHFVGMATYPWVGTRWY